MKKHLFLIAGICTAFSVNAQTVVKVVADTDVKVKPNTLFYVGGKMVVDNYTATDKKVSNEGNIRITENLENKSDTGKNFVEEHNGTASYGQLIVNNGTENVGKIVSEVKTPTGFSFLPLAIPYKGIAATDVVMQLFGTVNDAFPGYKGKPSYHDGWDNNRFKNAMFLWNNDDYRFDNLDADYVIGQSGKEASYYAINAQNSSVGVLRTDETKNLSGVPINNNVTAALKRYDMRGVKNTDTNKYGEAYGSYIIDFTEPVPSEWENYYKSKKDGTPNGGDFGSRIYQLGNPYTSNIDLSKLNGEFLSKVKAIMQYDSQGYTSNINDSQASGSEGSSDYSGFTAYTGDGTGDNRLAMVAPFQTFGVKMKKDMPETVNVEFTDAVKTFTVSGNIVNTMFRRGNSVAPVVNQVALDLFDANGNNTGVRTYVVASDIYKAAQKGEGTEIYNVNMSNEDTGIYTLQENEDGSISSQDRVYINGVNDAYTAKPIHLVFQNGKGKYSFRVRLNDALKNNKNAFYLEDKKQGKVVKLVDGETISVNVNGTEKDRFVMYWAATPKAELNKEVAKEAVNSTVVYKDGNAYKVRFDKSINKADVFVYNISGQLVNVSRGVNTQIDYVVPVEGNSSVYIVKIVGDNGSVFSKKIIK